MVNRLAPFAVGSKVIICNPHSPLNGKIGTIMPWQFRYHDAALQYGFCEVAIPMEDIPGNFVYVIHEDSLLLCIDEMMEEIW